MFNIFKKKYKTNGGKLYYDILKMLGYNPKKYCPIEDYIEYDIKCIANNVGVSITAKDIDLGEIESE